MYFRDIYKAVGLNQIKPRECRGNILRIRQRAIKIMTQKNTYRTMLYRPKRLIKDFEYTCINQLYYLDIKSIKHFRNIIMRTQYSLYAMWPIV